MQLNYSLTQKHKLKLNVNANLVQSTHVLQISSMDLEQYLLEQATENPFLEIVWTRKRASLYSSRATVKGGEDRQKENYIDSFKSENETLESIILSQLRINGVPDRYKKISAFLAGNLNDNGYVEIPLEEVGRLFGVSLEEVRNALSYLQSCEPAGIGATSLTECLQFQIVRHSSQAVPFAYEVVSLYLDQLARGKLQWLAEKLGASIGEIEKALHYIRSLNPRPGLSFGQLAKKYIEVDAAIVKEHGKYAVLMNEELIPKIRVHENYKRLEQTYLEVQNYVREQVKSAYWLIRCLEQRKSTVQRVIETIVDYQKPFFESGLEQLKPLNLKAIASKLNLHESTISRATQNKYVQTPSGIYELKFFFARGVSIEEGGMTSSESVKDRIKQLIDEENKENPLSDQKIKELLEQKGLQIARRTIMKYREEMQILSSRFRGVKV